MDNLRLPSAESATAKSLRVTAFATITSFLAFATGLYSVLHSIPGCSEAAINYIQLNAGQLALLIGIPTGVLTFAVSLFRPSVKTY